MNEWVFTNDGTKEIKWVKKVLRRNEKSHFKINIKRKKNEIKTVDYDKKKLKKNKNEWVLCNEEMKEIKWAKKECVKKEWKTKFLF